MPAASFSLGPTHRHSRYWTACQDSVWDLKTWNAASAVHYQPVFQGELRYHNRLKTAKSRPLTR
jgi:hypothetical protein